MQLGVILSKKLDVGKTATAERNALHILGYQTHSTGEKG